MLGIFRRIKYRKLSSSADSVPVKPPVLEKLEPRILLSGDSLFNIALPDPLQDALIDSTPQVVRHAELLETTQQLPTAGQEIHQELDVSDQPKTDLCEPIFTLFADRDDSSYGDAIDMNLSSG